MAFKKPTVKTIDADISNLSMYIRSVKKFGKSTLARDLILAKYNDPEKGLLVEIGHEYGDKLLDNVNSTHVDTYKDFVELRNWLIAEKGKEHDVKIIIFDVADEMTTIFEAEACRLSKIETGKDCKSIRQAFGGFNGGVERTAILLKEYISSLKKAGFGIIVLAHTKMKQVKEKASIEEDGYQVLTSNLVNAYESAFGDIADLVLTGYIDRNIETVGEGDSAKRYATTEIRKLYFRGTSLIDAGSRFSPEAVPDYMVFDKMNMGADFVKVIEDGIRNSRTKAPKTTKKVAPTPVEDEVPFEEEDKKPDFVADLDDDIDVSASTETDGYPADLAKIIRTMFKECKDANKKKEVKTIISSFGKLDDVDNDGLKAIYDVLN